MTRNSSRARAHLWSIGRMCTSGCAAVLERAVAKIPGVSSARANYASATLHVLYDPAQLEPGSISSVIRHEGFSCSDEAENSSHKVPPEQILQPQTSHDHEIQTGDSVGIAASHAPGAHEGMHHGGDLHAAARDMFRRFVVALIFGVPLFVWSPMGLFDPPPVPFGMGKQHWLFVLASLALLYPGWPFYTAAVRSLRHGILDMAVLVLLSVGTGYLFSMGATFLFEGADFYEATTVLLIFILLGHWLEMRARAGASDAMKSLLKLSPARALVRKGSDEVEIPTSDVLLGDIVVVRPGAKVPVDGEVIEGSSQVDESMLTGESMPVRKDPGSQVVGGAINKSGAFVYRATKVGAETALNQIIKLVQEAQNSKAPAQLLADRASQWLVLAAIVIGLLTFAIWFWWVGQTLLFAVTLTITVFVIACPDALGLATPMAIMIGTGMGARHGILFKHAEAIELSARLDVVIFDKTGTLTLGSPKVVEIVGTPDRDIDEVLRLAAAVDAHSEHPLAHAIVERAGPVAERARAFTNIDGRGAQGEVDGQRVMLGNRLLMNDSGVAMNGLEAEAERLQSGGRTVIHVGLADKVIGLIAIADAIRPSSRSAIDALHARDIKVAMITGDNRATAERVASELGIDIVLADVLPGGKAEEVKKLQAQGKRVAMVGDGINDAPALTQADVGFAIGAGTDVAIDSADVVLMRSDPLDAVRAIAIARGTLRKMHQNLAWAVGYNVIAFPLAAGVLYPFVLSPEIAALSMSGSSVIVAVNALLLRRLKLQDNAAPNAGKADELPPRTG